MKFSLCGDANRNRRKFFLPSAGFGGMISPMLSGRYPAAEAETKGVV